MKKMEPHEMRWMFAMVLLVLGFSALALVSAREKMLARAPSQVASAETPQEASVREVVGTFGDRLKMVSLSAPKALAAAAIRDNYSGIVWPDLVSAWMSTPSKAPGRFVSSPWPDRIEIASITQMSDVIYAVTGNVIELTSDNVAAGGIADQYPVFLTVEDGNGGWLITDYRDALARK